MTVNERLETLEAEAIAYASMLGGVEIKKIEYDVEDYVYCVCGAWIGRPSVHRLKIYYDRERAYFILNGYTVHLDDCIRT